MCSEQKQPFIWNYYIAEIDKSWFYPNTNADTAYDGNPVGGCPGTEYCGLKLAKLAAAAAKPGKLPALKPGGNWLITWAVKTRNK